MVKPHRHILVPTADELRAAPHIDTQGGRLEAFLQGLHALASLEAALALRLAMVLACIRQFDVIALGYSGFRAFCAERVDWGQAWIRALVRLVESPLDHVKAAAAAGALPLRWAVQAPGKVSVDEQSAWLAGPELEEARRCAQRRVVAAGDEEAVEHAREIVRTCLGGSPSLCRVDARILREWHEGVAGKALEEGRTPPPPPALPELDFAWAGADPPGGAPAEALLGPWEAPASLDEAVAQLEAVQAVRRRRVAVLARRFTFVRREELWRRAGFDSPWAFARHVLGWSRRTAQRQHALGVALDTFPQLDEAVRQGLSPDAARRIGAIAGDASTCARWLEVARHVNPQELARALENQGERLEEYERALGIARRHAAALLGPDGPAAHPSGTVDVITIGSSAESGDDDAAPLAGTPPADGQAAPHAGAPVPLRIALPPAVARRAAVVIGHPDLPEASRWVVANNPLPRPSGFAACKRRACFRCQNPECGRVTLLVEAHHVQWRSHGGSDDPGNAVVLCPACHLRGVHTRDERIRVTRVVVEAHEALFWEYPGRPPILQFREAP